MAKRLFLSAKLRAGGQRVTGEELGGAQAFGSFFLQSRDAERSVAAADDDASGIRLTNAAWLEEIGFGGLDHVLASGLDVNILVLDTEVYSNTGGQRSKATPLGAIAKFAASGKDVPKKDLGLLAMAYGNAYVAKIAMGAKDTQTVKALLEAESFPGPSLVIAYSPCIAHGYDLSKSLDQQKAAVASGYWPMYRFDPRRIENGEAPLVLDSPEPKISLEQFAWAEARFRMLKRSAPKRAKALLGAAAKELKMRRARYKLLANLHLDQEG